MLGEECHVLREQLRDTDAHRVKRIASCRETQAKLVAIGKATPNPKPQP